MQKLCQIFALNEFNALSFREPSSSQKTSSKRAGTDHFEKAEKKLQINIMR